MTDEIITLLRDRFDVVDERLDRMDAERGNARNEHSAERNTQAQFRAEALRRLDRLEVKLDYTNGRVRRGEELDELHANQLATLVADVTDLRNGRTLFWRIVRHATRPAVWVASIAAAAAITAAITQAVTG